MQRVLSCVCAQVQLPVNQGQTELPAAQTATPDVFGTMPVVPDHTEATPASSPKAAEFLKETKTSWYGLLENIGVIVFALSGLIVAYQWKASLYGAMLLSFLPPFGGGIMRDLIFGRTPIGFVKAQSIISVVFIIVLVGFFILGMNRSRNSRDAKERDQGLMQASALLDGVGLAVFTVTGCMVAVMLNMQPLWLWGPFAAMLTTTGGGILRDVMLKNHGASVVHGTLYPELALFWGWLLSAYIGHWQMTYAEPGVILVGTMLGTFATWAMIRALKIRNLQFGG